MNQHSLFNKILTLEHIVKPNIKVPLNSCFKNSLLRLFEQLNKSIDSL